MTAEQDRDGQRLAEAFRAIEGPSWGGDVDTERVWKAVAGELPPEERREIVDKVATDPAYAEAWRIAMDLADAAAAGAGEPKPRVDDTSSPGRGSHVWRSPYFLAAAAVLLVGFLGVVVPNVLAPPEPVFRGGTATIEPLVSPDQRLARDDFRLRWDAPDGARFDLRVTTEDLSSVDSASDLEASDYVVPEERLAEIPSGARVLWQVDARLPDGTFVRSDTFIAVLE